MKKIIALLLIWSLSSSLSLATPLKRGTSIIVRMSTSAYSNRDTPVVAEVANDITITGETVVVRGTSVIVSINKRKAESIGKSGYLQTGCISTTAVDGQPFYWRATLKKKVKIDTVLLSASALDQVLHFCHSVVFSSYA